VDFRYLRWKWSEYRSKYLVWLAWSLFALGAILMLANLRWEAAVVGIATPVLLFFYNMLFDNENVRL